MEFSLRNPRAGRARTFFLAIAVLVACTGAPAALAADAAADASPDAMILNLSTQVLDSIRNDKAIKGGDFSQVQKLVDERIVPRVDMDKMTRLTVGRPWRTATAEQRSTLIEQFRILLMRTYSGALAKVSDEKVRLRPSRDQAGGTDVIVRTQVVSSQGDPIELDYRLEKTDAGWKIYDINVLGIWLVENYRNEFLEPLNHGGIDNLIQTLTEKNRKGTAAGKAT